MPATTNKAAWQAIQSHLMAMGYSPQAMIGEPRSGVQDGMIAIIPQGGEVDETTLTAPREVHRCILRMYRNWLDEPQADTELVLDQFRADIMEDIFGDFELGGNVAHALPAEFAWEYGIETVENTKYRSIDLTVVYRIDPAATFAP